MVSAIQNGPKTMFFEDYSLLVVFDAYLVLLSALFQIYPHAMVQVW